MIVGSKRYVVLAAASSALLLATIPNLPAFAETVHEQESNKVLMVEAQSFSTGSIIEAATATRDEFTVTVFDIVQWPTHDHTVSAIGDYGPRGCWGCSSFHEGDDFNPGGGTPVEVVANGTVIQSGWLGALGEAVTVRHKINGIWTDTLYGHMQSGSIRVNQGQKIDRGTVLGLVGSTGASTGNHLHFEVHIGGTKINPMPWLLKNVNAHEWGLD